MLSEFSAGTTFLNHFDPAAKNCHLYLWTSNLFLWKSYALLEAWGFNYAPH
jgi:N6-adenosine-specific RNA methylase IME4